MISDIIKTQTKPFSLHPEAVTSTIHQIIANAINSYFINFFSTLKTNKLLVTGVLTTYAAGISTPLIAPCAYPINISTTLTVADVKYAFSLPANQWSVLFQKIGSNFSQSITNWTTLPTIIATPSAVLSTTHFYTIGTDFFLKLKSSGGILNSKDIDPCGYVWDLFETYLKTALKTIPPYTMFISGATALGSFNGTSIVNFNTINF